MSVTHLGIVGAGTMGAGIAINALISGLTVTLVDRSPEVLDKAKAKLARFLARQVEKGRLAPDAVPEISGRLTTAADATALADCDMVIEAVFENLELKKAIFADLEQHVSAGCVLATNTSCLRLVDIAEGLRIPARFCGLHYFSPAEINPVVEMIQGAQTDPAVLETAAAFLKATGKEAIACKDQNGFALNRFFCPYTNEAVHMLDGRAGHHRTIGRHGARGLWSGAGALCGDEHYRDSHQPERRTKSGGVGAVLHAGQGSGHTRGSEYPMGDRSGPC